MQKFFKALLFSCLIVFSSCSWFLSDYDGPVIISHEYVDGVTPNNSAAFNERSYPTVQANWSGPGGDKVWLAVNLGASEEPENSVDTRHAAAGWYFQFNRKQGYYHNGSTVFPRWRITNINEDTAWEPANDPCRILLGDPWRIPTVEELRAFMSAPVSQGGMGDGNRTAAFNSELRLHSAGNLHSFSGNLQIRGESGNYWASDQFNAPRGEVLGFSDSGSNTFAGGKAFGRSVRCLRDN